MREMKKAWGIPVVALVFALVLTACSPSTGPGGDPTSARYPSSYDDDGNEYTLVITKDPNRAAYTPQDGDSYVLTIKIMGSPLTSSGIVLSFSGGIFTLKLGDNTPFTETIDSGRIASISGDIPLDDNTTRPAPSSLTPRPPAGGSISGSYTYSKPPLGNATITFSSNGTFTITGTALGQPIQASGTYTVTRNTITCTTTASNDPTEIGEISIFTIIDANTIRDEDHGEVWTKS